MYVSAQVENLDVIVEYWLLSNPVKTSEVNRRCELVEF